MHPHKLFLQAFVSFLHMQKLFRTNFYPFIFWGEKLFKTVMTLLGVPPNAATTLVLSSLEKVQRTLTTFEISLALAE